jgi:signal transduction histidine kinase
MPGLVVPRIRVTLDEQYIMRSLLPRVLEQHFGADAALHYDMLTRATATGSVISRWGSGNNQPWEASVKILAIRPECLPVQSNQGDIVLAKPTGIDTPSLLRSVKCDGRPSATSGLWEIAVRSRPTVGESINSVRRRNLAGSFIVMLVLATAIAILFVSAHRARELAALHEQFAASVSHELRTPLSVISSASENLADGVVESADQMRQYGKMIRGHSEQLSKMIENSIWFARRDARYGLETGDVDVEELICTAAGTCGRMLEEAGVELERYVEPGLPAIRGNRTLLLHGLQNLLTNVASHGRSGKWARISAKLIGSDVAFTVEDKGHGVPSDEATRVFDPFYRGKQARKTGQAGLGLGLSLVKRVVEAHSGTIQLRSRRGQGTAIVLTIPVSEAHESS